MCNHFHWSLECNHPLSQEICWQLADTYPLFFDQSHTQKVEYKHTTKMMTAAPSVPDEPQGGCFTGVMQSDTRESKFDMIDVISGWCIEQISRDWFISFKYWMAKTIIFFLVLHRYLLVNSNFLSALPDAFNFSPEKIFSQFPSNLIWRGSRLSSRACRSMSACSWATWRKSPYLELCQTDFWESNAMLSSSKWWWILAWEGNFIKQDQYLSVEPSM